MKQLFSRLSADFLKNADIIENSRELYKRILSQFKKWVVVAGKDIKYLKRADIIEYKSYLMKSGKAENTIDAYLTVVRRFYEYAESIGEHENIAAGIKLRRKKDGFRKGHLTHDEVDKLLMSIDQQTVTGRRDFAIINLMIRSGMRCVELSRLRVCDITVMESGCQVLIQRKGDNARTVSIGLTTKSIAPVMEYISYRGISNDDDPVFVTHCTRGELPLSAMRISRIVKYRMQKADVYSKMKTTHSLRHTTAVMMILNNATIKDVQLLLGHQSVKTTEIYLRSIEDERRLNNPAVRLLDDLI